VTGLVSPAGELALDYAYDPFGNETTAQTDYAATWDNPFRYCGEYWDEETETYYLRARQYDPAAGRFLSEDTHWNPDNFLGESANTEQFAPNQSAISQSGNLYVYCISNPVVFADREGKAIEGLFDFLSFLDSAYAMYKNPSGKNLLFLLWDAGALIVPLAPGSYIGKGVKVLDSLDDVGDAAKLFDAGAIRETYKTLEEGVNFTRTTTKRMNDPNRFVPVQTLIQAIKEGVAQPDPQGTDAIMYTIQMTKYNKKTKSFKDYTLEVLYDAETNTILHFMYE